jgi:serine/threonine protein kinase
MNTWRVGDKIAGRFKILKILGGEGKSGMGIVYICYDNVCGMPFALKTFQEKYLLDKEALKLFEREAYAWIQLKGHPYIINAYYVERFEERLFIVLEYFPPDPRDSRGERNTLAHAIGHLTLPEILKFSIQFCFGMEYAYSKGIDAHRDIKPDNIFVIPGQIVKITDFGLAKAFSEIKSKEDTILSEERTGLSIFKTKGGKRVCGTLPYMAPEQFDGYADRRSDIYAFGIILYEAATGGKLPFMGKTTEEYERLHRYETVSQFFSPVFPVINRCLQKDPVKRYQDFVSVREELQNLLLSETGERVISPEVTDLREGWEWIIKAKSLCSLDRFDEAIVCLDKALEIDPRCCNGEAIHNKGVALSKVGKSEEAIPCFDMAIEINPKESEYRVTKGAILARLGRFKEALECVEEAIKINPEPSIYELKQLILRKIKEKNTVLLTPKESEAQKWHKKGISLANRGRYQQALSYYDKALEIDQTYSIAWYNKGFALSNLSRHQEAIACYDKALEVNPVFFEAWHNKGNDLFLLERYEEAMRCYNEVLKINSTLAIAQDCKNACLKKLRR